MGTIRLIKTGEDAQWLRMRIALWPEESEAWLKQESEAIAGRAEMSPVFVFDRGDGRLGGFLEANLRSTAQGCFGSPVAYIEGWYVDEDLRRQGVGGMLVHAAEEWAREKRCEEIASDCDLNNGTSLRAHLALGYVEETRLIHFRKVLGTARSHSSAVAGKVQP